MGIVKGYRTGKRAKDPLGGVQQGFVAKGREWKLNRALRLL